MDDGKGTQRSWEFPQIPKSRQAEPPQAAPSLGVSKSSLEGQWKEQDGPNLTQTILGFSELVRAGWMMENGIEGDGNSHKSQAQAG